MAKKKNFRKLNTSAKLLQHGRRNAIGPLYHWKPKKKTGEVCDCVAVYTGYPGATRVSMNIESGEVGRCSIYIGKDEPDPDAAYRHALAALEERIKGAAQGAANTQDGNADQQVNKQTDRPYFTGRGKENQV